MATLIHETKLSNVIDEADIVVLERDPNGDLASTQIDEGDPIRVLMKSKKWLAPPLNIEGRMFQISDEKKVAVFCCTRKYSNHFDPLIRFLPLLVSILVDGSQNYTFGLESLHMERPSTFRGVLVLCVSLDQFQITSIGKLFEPWQGTIYIINLKET